MRRTAPAHRRPPWSRSSATTPTACVERLGAAANVVPVVGRRRRSAARPRGRGVGARRRARTRRTSCTTPTRSPRSPTRGCAASTSEGPIGELEVAVARRWRAGGSARSSSPTTTSCSTPRRGRRRAGTGTSVCCTAPAPARVVPVPDPDAAARTLPRLGAGAWWPDLDDLLAGIEQVVPDQLSRHRRSVGRALGERSRRACARRRRGSRPPPSAGPACRRSPPGRAAIGDRAEGVAQLELRRVDALGDVVPRLAVARLGRFLAAGVGQREEALAGFGVGGDEALVLEELEGGVDRAGARSPHAVGALLELLDHLVAVHRTLAQEREGGGPHVAPPGPAARAATTAATAVRRSRSARADRPTGARVTGCRGLLDAS